MMSTNIEELIIKYINRSATTRDLDILSEWIRNPENEQVFKDFVRTHYLVLYSANDIDVEKELQRFLNTLHSEKSWSYRLRKQPVIKYAAVAVVVVGMIIGSYFLGNFEENHAGKNLPVALDNNIRIGENKAILTLEDGSQILLEKGKSTEVKNAKSDGEQLFYDKSNPKESKIEYNYLTVPRGGQFFIKLADDTQVWLNSESQLKYPVNFAQGRTREVELIYGEAFFDVSPSTRHGGADFKVYSNRQEVHVLGTEFNVKAYRDEANIYTTLVEGKVTITYGDKTRKIIPGEQLSIDLDRNSLNITSVDIYNEISWKEGVFSFDEKSLKEIMNVLARWYNIDVIIKDKSIEDRKFVGVLRKNQQIEDILAAIRNFGCFQSFTIKGKTVVLE
ncbi:FecR family protein [Sinomicrobium pectinilyticum]|uniref:FecR family protein n=1 Tax=Sinomicrobium pectinilyticum TaxID=1084421 RepID=A0A3N0E410_SINP1|nr:FecR domain-containing protein [Sinomicrobium pectinilyticum]RNL82499.1 FecR family protein [Sinomicrobium pectinilyticum]